MKKFLTRFLATLGLVSAFALVPAGLVAADTTSTSTSTSTSSGGSGINVFSNCGGAAGSTDSGKQICGADSSTDFNTLMKNIINTILIVLGMISVIMIIIGGIRYTTSNGDAGSIKSAKDTVLYAVIGLIIAIMAYAIVDFVLSKIGSK